MAVSSPAREPLTAITNSSDSSPRRSPDAIEPIRQPSNSSAPSNKKTSLRRKTAFENLPHLDSSESDPSYHSSLFDAPVSEGLDLTYQAASFRLGFPGATPVVSIPGEGHSTFLSTEIHIPHTLDPITERSSLSTLRPPSSHAHSLHAFRPPSANTPTPPRHRKSFSLPDLASKDTFRPGHPHSSTIYPLEPHTFPPIRPPTPPNLPSFGKREACTYRLPPPPSSPRLPPSKSPPSSSGKKATEPTSQKTSSHTNRLTKRFHPPPPPTPAMVEWRRQTAGLPRGAVVMRGEDGTLLRGKFTPGLSGHMGVVGRGSGVLQERQGSGIQPHCQNQDGANGGNDVRSGNLLLTENGIEERTGRGGTKRNRRAWWKRIFGRRGSLEENDTKRGVQRVGISVRKKWGRWCVKLLGCFR